MERNVQRPCMFGVDVLANLVVKWVCLNLILGLYKSVIACLDAQYITSTQYLCLRILLLCREIISGS